MLQDESLPDGEGCRERKRRLRHPRQAVVCEWVFTWMISVWGHAYGNSENPSLDIVDTSDDDDTDQSSQGTYEL